MKKLKFFILLSIIVLILLSGCSDFIGIKNKDVDIGNLNKVSIYLDNDEKLKLYNTVSDRDYVQCTIVVGDYIADAQIRVRGYTSRLYPKKSFTIKTGGQKYIYERGSSDAGIKNRIAMRAYQLAGLKAPNTESVGFFMNEEYLGCYNLIDDYDGQELSNYHNVDKAELFKCFFENYNDMTKNIPLRSFTEKKYPNDDDNYSNLEYLIASVIGSSDSAWRDFVYQYIDFDRVASYFAVHDFLAVRDTYMTNYYIFHYSKFYFLPWDNESCLILGTGSFGGDNQLTKRLFTVPVVKETYNDRIDELFKNTGTGNILTQLKDESEEMFKSVDAAARAEKGLDYNKFLQIRQEVADFWDKRVSELP